MHPSILLNPATCLPLTATLVTQLVAHKPTGKQASSQYKRHNNQVAQQAVLVIDCPAMPHAALSHPLYRPMIALARNHQIQQPMLLDQSRPMIVLARNQLQQLNQKIR